MSFLSSSMHFRVSLSPTERACDVINTHAHVYCTMNILIFTLQERQAPIMSDAARRKERELAQKEVSTNEKVTLASIENFAPSSW